MIRTNTETYNVFMHHVMIQIMYLRKWFWCNSLCTQYGGTPCEEGYWFNVWMQCSGISCVYASCDDIPEFGCIYGDGFGIFNEEFGAIVMFTIWWY